MNKHDIRNVPDICGKYIKKKFNDKIVTEFGIVLSRWLSLEDRRGGSIIPSQVHELFNKIFDHVNFFNQSGKNTKI